MAWLGNIGAEVQRVIREICDRPAHRERWAVLLSGIAIYPSLGVMIGLLVWFGMNPFVNAALVIPWFGWIAIGLLGLLGLVIIALLGIVRHIQVGLPNGAQIGLDIADKYDTSNPEKTDGPVG